MFQGIFHPFIGLRRAWQRRAAFSGAALAGILLAGLYGCAPNASPAASSPAAEQAPTSTGKPAGLSVQEYALIEQSADNPTHLTFQERVPGAVSARREGGWRLPGSADALEAANQALSPFGYRLAQNAAPPFSAYAVYQGSTLVQADIARFWPVSASGEAPVQGQPVLLAVETFDGERLVVSALGVEPWTGQNAGPVEPSSQAAPRHLGGELAYASLKMDGVYAGEQALYLHPGSSAPRGFVRWAGADGQNHWGLELENSIVVDGQDLNHQQGYEESFSLRLLNGQPLYFYTRQGLTRLNYAGRDLPFSYDQVVHHNQDALSIYNPGGLENLSWFYALRDGLWYYVEVGPAE